MRGKDCFGFVVLHERGIIPACAGKSFDNPKSDNSQLGSPPPVRGKVFGLEGRNVVVGITPAYAGKSL